MGGLAIGAQGNDRIRGREDVRRIAALDHCACSADLARRRLPIELDRSADPDQARASSPAS